MKRTAKFTVTAITLLLLTPQLVHAEMTLETTTTESTTQTTQVSNYQTREVDEKIPQESTYTGLVYENGDTFYYVNGKPLLSQWQWTHGRWYYFDAKGKMFTSGMTPDGYLVDADGKIADPGWLNANGIWYYALSEGKALRDDWKKIDGIWYAFHTDGKMYANEWNDSYYLKSDGAMADNEWIFDKNYSSWFYIKLGGSYAHNEWKDAYYLKNGGYMAQSEFIYDSNYKATYYLDENGQYVSDKWKEIEGKWYHFRKYGEMDINKWIGSYYVKSDGIMATNELVYDSTYNSFFYFNEDGQYLEGNQWKEIAGEWYYFKKGGYMAKSEWVDLYYLKENGRMAKNELIYDPTYDTSFYLEEDGKYFGGNKWKEINGDWYYFKEGGYMAKHQWIGSYYVKADGRMAKNEMLYDPSSESSYYFTEDETYAKNYWAKINSYWYYFKSNGKVARKEWIDNKYYVFDNGKMATGTHIINHYQYTFDESGNVLSKKAVDIGWVEKDGKRYFYNRAGQRIGDETAKKVMDVSEHQGYIANWESIIKDNGIDAVIVRIGYSSAEDKYLAHNISELNRLGVPYGIYLYTYASTETDGKEDAEQTLALIKKYNIKPTYPIYFDLEDWRYINGAKSAPTDTATWVKIWKAYRDTMAKAGYTNVRVYSYQYLLQNRLNDPEILKYVDWVAAYTPQLTYQLPYSQPSWGWQYTDKEFVIGLGNVDMSVWFGR